MPLTSSSVNLAGQPSKVGGTVARVFGWIALAGGWALALLFFLVFQVALFPDGVAGWVLATPTAVISSIIAWALLRSGKQLKQSGDDAQAATHNQALFALANTRGGVITAWDAAQRLGMMPQEADAILTKLAKEHPDYVTVDVDDNGVILYRFLASHWNAIGHDARHGVRVDVPKATRVANEPPVRVDMREPVEVGDDAPVPGERAVRRT